MKIRTDNELQEHLDNAFAWRLKEIADLKSAVRSSRSLWQATLIRAGVALLYAHWEGFTKNAVELYLQFVSCQHLRLDELASSFVVFGARKHVEALTDTHKASLNIAAVEFFLTKMSDRPNLSVNSPVNTRSNLSSEVFQNILLSVGLDPGRYEAKYQLIDTGLLKRRNSIAHGEYLALDQGSFRSLADEVITLMRGVKTDVENSVTNNDFRRAPPTPTAVPLGGAPT